jgi:gamma-tubulin complex component 3
MIQFVRQMQYYILFEVIECSWEHFSRRVKQAKDLDDILDAHKDFLECIRVGIFLEPESKQILLALSKAFESILGFEGWQANFYQLCYDELAARQQYEKDILDSEKKGLYGVTTETALERAEELKKFDHRMLKCSDELLKLRVMYEENVRDLMLLLTSSSTMSLQQFGIRLDFNDFYKKQNPTLQEPLRFEHLRMTMMVNGSGKRQSIGFGHVN